MRKLCLGTVALLATTSWTPAMASNQLTADQYNKASTALRVLSGTNLLTFGDASISSDVEGKVYVGGNLDAHSAAIDTGGAASLVTTTTTTKGKTTTTYSNNGGYRNDDRYRALTVGGSVTSGVTINNGIGMGSIQAVVGGNATGVVINNGAGTESFTVNSKTVKVNVAATNASLKVGGNFSPSGFNAGKSGTVTKTATYGGTLTSSNPSATYIKQDKTLAAKGTNDLKASIAAMTATTKTDMLALSQILGALSTNATLDSSNRNNIHFTFGAAANASDYAVADITAAQLASGTFVLPTYATTSNDKTLIINVSGSNVTIGANMTGNGSLVQQNIIWNFMDATTVSVNTALYGSILAPKASVSSSSQINGSVVAQVFESCAEVHLGTFSGNTHFLVAPAHSGGGSGSHEPGAIPEPSSWMTMLAGFSLIGSLIRRQRRRERLAAA